MALARPPASGDRKHQPDMARIDFLLLGGFRPPTSGVARRALGGTARTGHSLHPPTPSQTERQRRGCGRSRPARLRLRPRRPPVLGQAGLRHPVGGAGPALRQKQAQADHHRIPRPAPASATPAFGNWRSCRAPRRIAARRRPNATPSSPAPCRRRQGLRWRPPIRLSAWIASSSSSNASFQTPLEMK